MRIRLGNYDNGGKVVDLLCDEAEIQDEVLSRITLRIILRSERDASKENLAERSVPQKRKF